MKKPDLSSFAVGFLFAIGLGVSGMTQPKKVIGFLDLFGEWDPSLIFVMLGAILVHLVLYRIIRKRNAPLFSESWHIPTKKEITRRLIVGSLIFGLGWGIAGYCPGPALVSLATFTLRPALFVLFMLIGMKTFQKTIENRPKVENRK